MPRTLNVSMMRRLAALVGSGSSVAAAGRKLELDPSTASAWGRTPRFKAMVERFRSKLDDQTIGMLAQAATKAAATLERALDSPNEHVRVSAAKILLEKRHEVEAAATHARRLAEIQQTIAALASSSSTDQVITVEARPAALGAPATPEVSGDGQTHRDATERD